MAITKEGPTQGVTYRSPRHGNVVTDVRTGPEAHTKVKTSRNMNGNIVTVLSNS